MSLDKAIKYGKEHRKSWEGTNKQYAHSCRNHGGCSFCTGNRLHKFRDKHPQTMEEAIEDSTEVLETACPECGNHLFQLFSFETNVRTYRCTYCGHFMEVWNK